MRVGQALWLGGPILTPTPLAVPRNPEGQELQEAMPAGHHHPGQHLRERGLPLSQHLGPPGQEGRSALPTHPLAPFALQEAPK